MLSQSDHTSNDDGGQSPPILQFANDPEPWLHPVDGSELLDDLTKLIKRHIGLPDGAAEVVALWIVFTYAHDAFSISPILGVTAPQKGSGKTTLLTLLGALVRRPLLVSNISTAGVYRITDRYRATLLIDEADTFLDAGEESLRGVLNSGHQRQGAQTVRMRRNNGDFEPQVFSTWAPKVIAKIGPLPDTLEDRSISIRMLRARPTDTLEHLRIDRLAQLEPYRRKAWRWASDHFDKLSSCDPKLPAGLVNRPADNWRPLQAVAEITGGHWPTVAHSAALKLLKDLQRQDLSEATLLLHDLRKLFVRTGKIHLTSAEIIDELTSIEDRPWADWRHGRPLTKTQLARLLKPFGIRPRMLSAGARGYALESCSEIFDRYLPPLEVQELQPVADEVADRDDGECNHGDQLAPHGRARIQEDSANVASLAGPRGGSQAGASVRSSKDTEPPSEAA